MRGHLVTIVRYIGVLIALAASASSPAAIITVGEPGGPNQPCDFNHFELQNALDYANSNGDSVNEVRLMYQGGDNSAVFYDQSVSLTLDAGKQVTITGGYGSCTQVTGDGTRTNIDGHKPYDTDLGSVLSIHAGSGSTVRLRLLNVGGGQTALNDAGGAIYYSGDGTLDIADCDISTSDAGYGGGIYAEGGGGTNGKLLIGANVHVFSNKAAYFGGGIRIAGLEMTMNGSGSYITQNKADTGDGGGLAITGHSGKPGKATVSSPGNAISNNTANRGGGVAVMANDSAGEGATLILRSGLVGNFAHYRGGGIFAREEALSFPSSWVDAVVHADSFAHIDQNAAPDGAAVYLDYAEDFFGANYGATFTMTTGTIDSNLSMDDGSNFTDGAIIFESDGSFTSEVDLTKVTMQGNHGGPLVRNDDEVVLKDVLIADNVTSSSIIDGIGSDGLTQIIDSTITANQITGANVLTTSSDLTLKRLIIDQPGKTTLQNSGGTLAADYILASAEIASLAGGSHMLQANPRFIDPDYGYYALQAASPAVDFAPADATEPADIGGAPRDIDLVPKANASGPRDLGVAERQALLPLVLNGDFDADLRLWTGYAGTRDTTSNATGAAGSGSWKYSASSSSGTHVVLAQQCVFLPGPGRYVINGWGHTSGFTVDTRDYARLGWEFRYDGYEACTNGTPSASGEFTLGHSTSWTQAAAPAIVDVFGWSRNSSITLYLIAGAGTITTARTINAWFDGITIDVQPLSDLIFSDGFN
jgi:hypothetical protein